MNTGIQTDCAATNTSGVPKLFVVAKIRYSAGSLDGIGSTKTDHESKGLVCPGSVQQISSVQGGVGTRHMNHVFFHKPISSVLVLADVSGRSTEND